MKILITGATGFVGKHLVNFLKERDFDIIATGRNEAVGATLTDDKVKFIALDLTDADALQRSNIDADMIVHCAALSSAWGKKQDFYQNNVIATKNLVAFANTTGVKRIIHISSSSVYFDFKNKNNIREDAALPKHFVNDYAWSKYLAEQVIMNETKDDVEKIILRPRGIFGEGDTAIMPRLLQLVKKGSFPVVDQGRYIVDITHVENVCQAIWLALKTDCIKHHCYNITDDEPQNFSALMSSMFTAMKMEIKLRNLPYFMLYATATVSEWWAKLVGGKEPRLTRYGLGLIAKTQTLDIDRAKEDLDYKPIVSTTEGMYRYANWYRKNVVA